MKVQNGLDGQPTEVEQSTGRELLRPLVAGRVTTSAPPAPVSGGVVVGELIGIADEGRTPLVVFSGQRGSAAIRARSIVDLHGTHIGMRIVLAFEEADPDRPIVVGLLREDSGPSQPLSHVEIEKDGERMIVSAKTQLVLRCGKASITLTETGKILIEGTYVSSRSTGVNRLKGGSIHLN